MLTDDGTAYFASIKKRNKSGKFIEEMQKIVVETNQYN